MKSSLPLACTIAVAVLAGANESSADAIHHTMVAPGDLEWSDVPSLPHGAKIAVIEGPMSQPVPFTVRLKFPAHYRIPPHWHPAIERVTVLSGTLYMGTGERLEVQNSMALVPGSIMLVPPKSSHYAWTKEEVEVQLHGTGPWGVTYVDPADDPRNAK
jgi:hypothetical protein